MRARIGLILALVAAGAGSTQSSPNKKLRLAGQISARRYSNIAAPLMGGKDSRPLELTYLVNAGALVRKGQTIAQLAAQPSADQGEEAADEVKQTKSEIVRRKAEQAIALDTLQQSLRQAKLDADSARLDARQAGSVTDTNRELLRLNEEEAETRYTKLQEALQLQRASFDAEIRILELSSERRQRNRDRYVHDLSQFVLKAPMEGLVVMQSIARGQEVGMVRQGDLIAPGQTFMKVVDAQSMQLEAWANQAESSLLRIGQNVDVRLDGRPGVSLPGRIYSIGALAVSSGGQNYYIRNIAVNIAIQGSDARLLPDLPASGDVALE
jgi:HlyD family secretion protein